VCGAPAAAIVVGEIAASLIFLVERREKPEKSLSVVFLLHNTHVIDLAG
jgi:hypothetical protein